MPDYALIGAGASTPDAAALLIQSTLIVVGLTREARILVDHQRVAIGSRGLAAALTPRPSAILSFGICGALDPGLRVGDLVIADGVAIGDTCLAADAVWTAELRSALPAARPGDIAGGDVIIDSLEAKSALWRATGAVAVDMESHAVARAASNIGIPFAVVRAVSDTADRALPRAAQAGFRTDGEPDVGAVISALARRPWELPALIRVALEAEAAFRTLERAARAI